MPRDIVWRSYEHSHTEKTPDWFWALGIVAFSSAVVAVLFNNILFALLIVVAAFTTALLTKKKPLEREFSLTPRGILIDNELFPYQMMESFWIQDRETNRPILLIDVKRFLVPHIISVLPPEGYAETVQTYLEQYLPEVEMYEPIGQRLLEYFGF